MDLKSNKQDLTLVVICDLCNSLKARFFNFTLNDHSCKILCTLSKKSVE